MTVPVLAPSIGPFTFGSPAATAPGTTTTSFTPAVNDIIVVLAIAEGPGTHTPPTSAGLTFDSVVADGATGSCSMQLWAATVDTGQDVSRTIAMGAFSAALWHSAVAWVVRGGVLTGNSAAMLQTGTGAPSGTVDTTSADSLLLWGNGDFAAAAPGAPAYRSSAVQTFLHDRTTANYAGYYARQAAASSGAQAVGLTAPTGQTWKLMGIEIKDSAAALSQADGSKNASAMHAMGRGF